MERKLMTSVHAILIVLIRLWAAGFIISGILSLSHYLLIFYAQASSGESLQQETIGFVNFYLGYVVTGLVVWIFAPGMSARIFPVKKDEVININIKPELLVSIGGFLIGGFYLADYGPQLIADFGRVFFDANQQGPNSLTNANQNDQRYLDRERVFKNGLVVAVALWMVFRPRDLAHIFSTMRKAGLYKATNKE